MQVLVIGLLLVAPGLLLVHALRRGPAPRSVQRTVEDLGLAVAASMALLVVVGTALGHVGLYRFATTGAPVVEGALLAIAALCGVSILRGRVRARRAVTTEA